MKLTDADGKVSFDVLGAKEVADKSKAFKKAYKDAMKEYSALKGEEKKEAKKPVKPSVKKIKTMNDMDAAAKKALELQRKHDGVVR